MTGRSDIERVLDHFLAEGATSVADRALANALEAVDRTPQRRDLLAPWRFHALNTYSRLAAVAIVAVVAIGGALYLVGPRLGFGPAATSSPGPTPSITASASAAGLDVGDWTPYTSERYGFRISHPAAWARSASSHAWKFPDDADWQTPAVEKFVGPDLRVTAWSVKVDPGTTSDAWIEAYCPASTEPCSGIAARSQAASIDGHAGVIVPFQSDTQAFFLVGEHMYVVAAWRAGFQDYLEAFLTTVELLPGGPAASALDTARWERYTSERYGFEISRPSGWIEHPADRNWAQPTDGMSTATEGFESANEQVLVSAWSVALDPGTPLESWLQTYCDGTTAPCTQLQQRSVPATTGDGTPGILVAFDSDVQAFIPVRDRVYVIALWRGQHDPSVTEYGGGRRLLETFLSTVTLDDMAAPLAPS